MKKLSHIFGSKQQFQKINNSLGKIKKIQIVWNKIIKENSAATNVLSFFAHSNPASLDKGVLSIACQSSLISNHARFIHEDIIQELKKHGISHVSSITVHTSKQDKKTGIPVKTKVERNVDEATLETLKQFTQSCVSEPLKESTQKLLKRLEQIEKDKK